MAEVSESETVKAARDAYVPAREKGSLLLVNKRPVWNKEHPEADTGKIGIS